MHLLHINNLFYLSLSYGSPKIKCNRLAWNISVYGYGTPKITRLFCFVSNRNYSFISRRNLFPLIFSSHTVARSGYSLYKESLFVCIVKSGLHNIYKSASSNQKLSSSPPGLCEGILNNNLDGESLSQPVNVARNKLSEEGNMSLIISEK